MGKTVKLTSVLAVVGALVSMPSIAADMAVAPMVPRAEAGFSWTGFYLGAHGGYGWGKDRHTESFVPAGGVLLQEVNAQGWLLGGHAGYNWQYGMWVAGLEIDMSATNIKGTVDGSAVVVTPNVPPISTATTTSRSLSIDYLATARARAGIVLWQHFFLYGTGGLAWTKTTQDFTQTSVSTGGLTSSSTFTSSFPTTLLGAAVGVGGEASLAGFGLSNVLLRVEYLHYDFGKQASNSSLFTNAGFTSASTSNNGRLTVDVVRGGVTLKF